MDAVKLFRGLVVASLALLAASFASLLITPDLPEPISDWIGSEGAGPLFAWVDYESTGWLLLIGAVLLWTGAHVAALLAALRFRRWSRAFLIISTAVGLALLPFTGFTLNSALDTTLDTLLNTCDGALLVMLLLEPIRGRFRSGIAP